VLVERRSTDSVGGRCLGFGRCRLFAVRLDPFDVGTRLDHVGLVDVDLFACATLRPTLTRGEGEESATGDEASEAGHELAAPDRSESTNECQATTETGECADLAPDRTYRESVAAVPPLPEPLGAPDPPRSSTDSAFVSP